MNDMSMADLHQKFADVSDLISSTRPGNRHHHLSKLHELVGEYSRKGMVVPSKLRQMQEDLTNEAIESRFDNLPV